MPIVYQPQGDSCLPGRFIKQAIEYEVERQADLLDSGGKVVQETRLFDSNTGMTRSMRGKEEAHDYRYFPEPDLLPLKVSDAWLAAIKSTSNIGLEP